MRCGVVLSEMVVIMKDTKIPILETEGAGDIFFFLKILDQSCIKRMDFGGGSSCVNQPISLLQHAREEALNPFCVGFGKSDPVSPDILKSKEITVCRDLWQRVWL